LGRLLGGFRHLVPEDGLNHLLAEHSVRSIQECANVADGDAELAGRAADERNVLRCGTTTLRVIVALAARMIRVKCSVSLMAESPVATAPRELRCRRHVGHPGKKSLPASPPGSADPSGC